MQIAYESNVNIAHISKDSLINIYFYSSCTYSWTNSI